MENVKRWYVYLVSAVTIQGVTWAAINLVRNLIIPGIDAPTTAIAFQVSSIIVALPLFLAHWIWAQRQAAADVEERSAIPRLLYLYVMMAAFLGPMINNAYYFIRAVLHSVLDVTPRGYAWQTVMSPGRSIWFNLIPIAALGLLWFYHRRVRASDEATVPANDVVTIIRQVYVYLFTITGLVMAVLASITLLRWLLVEPFSAKSTVVDSGRLFLAAEFSRLLVGTTLWLVYWRTAQRLFYGPADEERGSLVRKAYLYLVVFGTVMTVVTVVTVVLSDALARLMDVPSGGGDIREAIAIFVIAGLVWAYHAFVLRHDAAVAEDKEQQANIRRIYQYLTAGIGLAAVLTGLVGILNAVIQALSSRAGFIIDLREQLAISTAVLLSGLPLWLVNWSRAQKAALQAGPDGQAERRGLVRRVYLYAFLFVATMAILGSAIYILSQIVELVLGARSGTLLLRDLGQALAYMVIAGGVWLYHGSILRREGRLVKKEDAEKMRPLRVAVIDAGDGHLGQALLERIHQQLPSVELHPIGLSPEAAAAMNGEATSGEPEKILAEAELIVGPWNMAMAGAASGLITEAIAHGVASNPAPKVLIPVRDQGWEWTGVERWKEDNIVKEATAAIKQMAAGEEPRTRRRLGVVPLILIVLGSLCILTFIVPLIFSMFM